MANLLGPSAFGAARAAATRPAVTPDSSGSDTFFQDCSSPLNRDGTEVRAGWLNAVTALLRGAIRGGQVAENNADDMLTRAIRSQRTNFCPAASVTGSANAPALAFSPTFSSLADLVGVPLRFIAEAANTGAVTIAVDGLAATALVRPDGSALQANDLAAGQMIEVMYDGTAFKLFAGSLFTDLFIISDITRTVNPGGGGDFLSINDALAWLRRRIPLRGVTVTLSLAAGIHAVASDIVVDWPYGQQLKIVGATMSGADPAPADFTTTGYGPAQRAADATTNATMLRSRYNTELELNGASFIITGGLGLLDDVLLIRSGGTKIGLVIENCLATLGTVSVHGMEADGVVLDRQAVVIVNSLLSSSDSDGTGGQYDGIEFNDGSSLFGTSAAILAIGNAGPGIEMQHRSYLFAGQCRAMGNAMDGARVLWGAHLTVGNSAASQFSTNGENGIELDVCAKFNSTGTPVAASSNFLSGVWVNNQSFAFVPSMTGTSNGRYGLEVLMASAADATNANPASNTLGAFFANVGSTIENAGGSGTASPAVNTVGNSNSFIRR